MFYACRRLWQHVTKSLKEGNIDEATEHKHRLEERQREDERKRAALEKPWTPKYFTKEVTSEETDVQSGACCWRLVTVLSSHLQGEGWIYNNPLWKST